jgi:hypothetical protein
MRRLRYTGPGAVLVTTAHERSERRGALGLGLGLGRAGLTLRELPGRPAPVQGQVLALAHNVRLWVGAGR